MPRSKTPSLLVGQVAEMLARLAPPWLAQSWDNVGLLAGDPAAACGRALLCIDMTPLVVQEAMRTRCDLVVAYHPPLFQPLKRLLAGAADAGDVMHQAIAAGLAVYSPHTALDAAPGGTNDVIAGMCGLTEVEPFEYVPGQKQEHKVVTFVPSDRVDAVAAAMAAAGAGRIGEYEQCSFRSPGTGTFFGMESTHPRVGEKGRLEQVPEIRLEMICAAQRLPEVTAALRVSHPYEEPAFDVYPLTAEPVKGIGRVGRLPAGTTLAAIARRLARGTGSRVLMLVGDERAELLRAAVCVGAAGRLPLERPRSANCDLVVTGEIRHHEALALLRQKKCAVALGHWESERPALASLADRLRAQSGGLEVAISKADAPPFRPLAR